MADLSYFRLLSGFYVATFAIRMSFGISVTAFGDWVPAHHGDFVYGLIVAASPLTEIATVLWVGVTIDRYGRRKFLLAGLAVGALGLYPIAFTQDVIALAILNALHGFAAGLILVSSLTLLADYAAKDSRGREMGAFDFVNLFGWATGIVAGVFFAKALFADNLAYAFLVSGTVAMLGFAYAYYTVHEPLRERFTSPALGWQEIRRALAQRRLAFLVAPWFAVFLLISSSVAFLTRALGSAETALGETAHGASSMLEGIPPLLLLGGLVAAGVAFFAFLVFFGRMSDRYGRVPLMMLGSVGFAAGTTLAAVVVWITPHAPGELPTQALQTVAPLIALFGLLVFAFLPSALAALADIAHERAHGTTMSVYSLVISAGWVVGPPLAGFLNEAYGVNGALAMFALAGLTMPLFVGLLWREDRRLAKPAAPAASVTAR
ncbi:MAG TPA: MFS transporter [Candidatus Thermoplasmatota archaeon]|nr:MFS transporter [Candidatus Thermoplasmatota archaeon]